MQLESLWSVEVALRRVLAGGSPFDAPDSNFPYAITLLFLFFMAVMLAWEIIIGTLSWALAGWGHVKHVLVDRLKEELLALGVVSLVLAFSAGALSQICASGGEKKDKGEGEAKAKESKYGCAPGTDPLFPTTVINAAHYLLFWIAVVQILYTLVTLLVSSLKFHRVLRWEHEARYKPAVQERAYYGGGCWPSVRDTVVGGLNSDIYGSLRKLLLLRMQCDPHSHELRTINLAVASEQLLHEESGAVHAHTWLQVLFIALLMLYTKEIKQAMWVLIPSFLLLLVIAVRQQYVLRRAAQVIEDQLPEVMDVYKVGPSELHQHGSSASGIVSPSSTNSATPFRDPVGMVWRSDGTMALSGVNKSNKRYPSLGMESSSSAQQAQLLHAKPGSSADGAVFVTLPPEQHPKNLRNSSVPLERTHTMLDNSELVNRVHALQQQVKSLFLIRPHLLLWLLELVIVCNASAMTVYLFELTIDADTTAYIPKEIQVILLLFALLMAVYIGWVVMPQYAVLTTAAYTSIHTMIHHLQHANVVSEEAEHGMAGFTVKVLDWVYWSIRRCCLGGRSHHDRSSELATVHGGSVTSRDEHHDHHHKHLQLSQLANAWMGSLALRSGIVLPGEHTVKAQEYWSRHSKLFTSIVATWRYMMVVSKGGSKAPAGGFVVNGGADLAAFHQVFSELDADGSGVMQGDEFKSYLKEAFNVNATNKDVKAMLMEIGSYKSANTSEGVTFHNFVMFACFAFLDPKKKGFLDTGNMRALLSEHELFLEEEEVRDMMTMAYTGSQAAQIMSEGGVAQMRPLQFLEVLKTVRLEG